MEHPQNKPSVYEGQLIEQIEQNRLYYILYANKVVHDMDIAEDVFQDSAMKAFSSIHTYSPKFKLTTWFHKIVRNTAIDYARKKTRENQLYNKDFDDETIAVSYALAANHNLHCLDLEDLIKNTDMTKTERAAFNMRAKGYQYKEIAKAFDTSIGTVKAHIFRARSKMRPYRDMYI